MKQMDTCVRKWERVRGRDASSISRSAGITSVVWADVAAKVHKWENSVAKKVR